MDLNYVKAKWLRHLALKKGPNRMDHQLDQQWDPTLSLDHLHPSIDQTLCPSRCLTQIIIFLLAVKKMGRDLTYISLMEYMKYSFDTEDELSNSKSFKQYKSPHYLHGPEQHESGYHLHTYLVPGEKLLQPPLFRKAIATNITYFLWIQYDYNLSCMISKHWVLTKIFPNLQKLPIFSWSYHVQITYGTSSRDDLTTPDKITRGSTSCARPRCAKRMDKCNRLMHVHESLKSHSLVSRRCTNACMAKITSVQVLRLHMVTFPHDEVYFKRKMIYIHA